jgi:hypothetical protein
MKTDIQDLWNRYIIAMQPKKKPKKSELIKKDVSNLIEECYELRRITESAGAKDAYDYVISELTTIIRKEY